MRFTAINRWEGRPGRIHCISVPRRDRILISTCLVIVVALAWTYLVVLGRRMSLSGHDGAIMAAVGVVGTPWTPVDLLLTFVMWTVMMVGMMGVSAAPVLLVFGATRTAREEGDVAPATLAFSLGYAAVWTAFSLVATLAQWMLHETAILSPEMAASNPLIGGAILIGAGVYQLTPFKGACLAHCRSPLAFLLTKWKNGRDGAFRMGVEHGTFCLGCCWALMCVLFVVGVMNLVWVAALAVFVFLERIGPAPRLVGRAAGIAMIIIGLSLVARIV